MAPRQGASLITQACGRLADGDVDVDVDPALHGQLGGLDAFLGASGRGLERLEHVQGLTQSLGSFLLAMVLWSTASTKVTSELSLS